MSPATILLTRPSGENEALAARLQNSGCRVKISPLLELNPLPADASLSQTAIDLDRWDKIIFVSKTSARLGMKILDQYWPAWPTALEWLAVGAGTAMELAKYGIAAAYPQSPGSEGLLALPEMQELETRSVLIVRGVGGREFLYETLSNRGAKVSYWEVYQRCAVTQAHLTASLCQEQKVTVVLTSIEILDNFVRHVDQASEVDQLESLYSRCIAVVPSVRVAAAAHEHPFQSVRIAGGASDQALYDAILQHTKR